jgi:hypothetical protein
MKQPPPPSAIPTHIQVPPAPVAKPILVRSTHIGDWRGLAGVEIKASQPNARIRVEVWSTKFVKPSRVDVTLADPNETYFVYPLLEFDYDQLRSVKEPTPETITCRVSDFSNLTGDKPRVTTRKHIVTVRAISDCPFHRGREDWRWMFAAYVNENSPIVEHILQEALHSGITNTFADYQGDSERHIDQHVFDQTFAIWYTLEKHGIKYSNIVTPSGESTFVFSQTVRPIEDSFQYQQANCVDGSVLFASILRKIGLHARLVLIPGHCFVMVFLDKAETKPFYIETTMIGSVDLGQYGPNGASNSTSEHNRQMASRLVFQKAVNFALKNALKHRSMNDLTLIDVDRLRSLNLSTF